MAIARLTLGQAFEYHDPGKLKYKTHHQKQ